VLEQCAAVIFKVGMRSCGVGRSVAAHLSFTRRFRKEILQGVLQLVAAALIWCYTCNCGLLSDLQDPTYEADSRSSADIPYLKCDFDVNFTSNFGVVVSCFSVIVFACILSMNIYVKY